MPVMERCCRFGRADSGEVLLKRRSLTSRLRDLSEDSIATLLMLISSTPLCDDKEICSSWEQDERGERSEAPEEKPAMHRVLRSLSCLDSSGGGSNLCMFEYFMGLQKLGWVT